MARISRAKTEIEAWVHSHGRIDGEHRLVYRVVEQGCAARVQVMLSFNPTQFPM
jgi:Txe/YoeB family toxin of Txe-Axe toxin-antitoxin module